MTKAAAFFDETSEAFDRHYGTDRGFRERLDVWRSLLELYGAPGRTLLDVGCGPGHLSCHAAAMGMSVVGIDPSPSMLALARARAAEAHVTATFEQGALESLRTMARTADVVVCSSVLEYIDDLRGALALLRRAVRPGGHVIVSLPNAACWYRRAETIAHALFKRPAYRALVRHVVTAEAFGALCAQEHLSIVDLRYFSHHHPLRVLNRFLDEPRQSALFVAVLALT